MTFSYTLAAALLGVVAAVAILLLVTAFARRPLPHLRATITGLRDAATYLPDTLLTDTGLPVTVGTGDRFLSRTGDRLVRALRVRPSEQLKSQLELRSLSLSYLYGLKLAWAAIGFVGPGLIGFVFFGGLGLPLGLSLVGAVLGWLWPSASIARMAGAVHTDMNESILVFIDLVTLGRLSNATARDAIVAAADLSDQPLFRQIRMACDRADLQQEPPWRELERLAERLRLPALGDVVAIARMQDEGAALAGALRARVRDLRDEWVSGQIAAANRVSTRLQVPMALTTVVLCIIFITPAILSLNSS